MQRLRLKKLSQATEFLLLNNVPTLLIEAKMYFLIMTWLLMSCGESLSKDSDSSYGQDVHDKVIYQDEVIREQERTVVSFEEADLNLSEIYCQIKISPPSTYGKYEISAIVPKDCEEVFDNSQSRVYLRFTVKTYTPISIYMANFYNVEFDKYFNSHLGELVFSSENNIENIITTGQWGRAIGPDFFADKIIVTGTSSGIDDVPRPSEILIDAFRINSVILE
ncbi:MAG: hypothetical protein EOP48_14280 [Sphingobacteriales bacterium]|nr:MAG: hypothetical protein EOP48_14280 [Sphingobacteriales bacterium]